MGRVSSALHNAVVESWHSTTPHLALGMRSPITYELALHARGAADLPEGQELPSCWSAGGFGVLMYLGGAFRLYR
jgi:hypothetical protein